MRRRLARSVLDLDTGSGNGRVNLFAWRHHVGLKAAIAGGTTAGKVGDAVGMGFDPMGRANCDHLLSIAWVSDRNRAKALGRAGIRGVVGSAFIAGGDHDNGAVRDQALALITNRGATYGV